MLSSATSTAVAWAPPLSSDSRTWLALSHWPIREYTAAALYKTCRHVRGTHAVNTDAGDVTAAANSRAAGGSSSRSPQQLLDERDHQWDFVPRQVCAGDLRGYCSTLME